MAITIGEDADCSLASATYEPLNIVRLHLLSGFL
jgi:hypothetical protein